MDKWTTNINTQCSMNLLHNHIQNELNYWLHQYTVHVNSLQCKINFSIIFNTHSMWYKIWSRGPETEFLKEKLKSDYSGLVFVEAHMVLYNKSTILMWG